METRNIRNVDISSMQDLPMIDFIGNDFAIFDSIKDIPLSSCPTRLNAACFIVCLKGRCKMNINLQDYELSEGMMGIVLPDQIVQQEKCVEEFSGLFIAISKGFIDGGLSSIQQLFPLFFLIKERPCVKLTPENLQSFREYHSLLWSKVKLKDNPFRTEIAQGLLLALFYEIYAIYQGHDVQEHVFKNRKEDLFERFLRCISESYKEERSVSYYADKMFLTSKHLSTVVKEVSGKTAGEWIDDLVVLEAKALLKSSEMSVQEIADELHFSNQSFFGKYFKHHTGVSPKEYRKQ